MKPIVKPVEIFQLLKKFEGQTRVRVNQENKGYGEQFFPLWFEVPEEYLPKNNKTPIKFLFPYEPMIDISLNNKIIKRYIQKGKHNGSVKEYWGAEDWNISIVGALMDDDTKAFPKDDMQTLHNFFLDFPLIRVFCEPFQLLGIHYICIESMSFPFTKGENVQAYEIKAVSDTYRALAQDNNGFNMIKPLLIEIDKDGNPIN